MGRLNSDCSTMFSDCGWWNRGVFGPPISDKTVQGYDLQFGTNVLGHFLFTKLLLPTMIRTVDTSLGSGASFV